MEVLSFNLIIYNTSSYFKAKDIYETIFDNVDKYLEMHSYYILGACCFTSLLEYNFHS